MNDFRRLISWLLLGGLVVVGAGAAVLGVSQAPKNAPLLTAVTNTLTAPNYSQVWCRRPARASRPNIWCGRPPIGWAGMSRAATGAATST